MPWFAGLSRLTLYVTHLFANETTSMYMVVYLYVK